MYSMCLTYQQDIARYLCIAIEGLRIPVYAHTADDASLPYMHIGCEDMKPVFRGKGCHTLECVLFSAHYSEALVLNVNRVLYDIAQSLVCLEHHVEGLGEGPRWKSENKLRFIKHTVKETKQHTTVTWGAEVSTKWITL